MVAIHAELEAARAPRTKAESGGETSPSPRMQLLLRASAWHRTIAGCFPFDSTLSGAHSLRSAANDCELLGCHSPRCQRHGSTRFC